MFGNRRLLLVVSLCLMLCACTGPASQMDPSLAELDLAAPGQLRLRSTPALVSNYTKTTTSSATAHFPRQVAVLLEADEAIFEKYHVASGSFVQKGDLLATFTKQPNTAAVQAKQIELDGLTDQLANERSHRQAEIDQWEMDLRFNRTDEDFTLLQIKIDRAKLELERQETALSHQISLLQAELSELKSLGSTTEVYAPVDGYLASTSYIRQGDRCQFGQSLALIYLPENFMVECKNISNRFKVGMDVTIEYGRKNDRKTMPGKVVSAQNLAPSGTEFGAVLVRPTNEIDISGFTPADFMNISVHADTISLQNVLLLPKAAISQKDKVHYASIIQPDGSAALRPVLLGMNAADQVWVYQGIEEGQAVSLD